jgi:hypothetical protein
MPVNLSNLAMSNVSAGTSGSTPPSGDPYWSSVSLLLETALPSSITDATGKNIITNYFTAVNGSVYQVGTSSAEFADSCNLKIASTSNFGYGTGDFTIEYWVYNRATSVGTMLDQRFANDIGVQPAIYTSTGTNLVYYTAGGNQIIATDAMPSYSTWYFVAVSKNSGITRMFVNGTQVGSFTDSYNYGNTIPLTFGSSAEGLAGYTGYMQQLRITKGVGRYTGNFTTPTQPFPTN